MNSLFHLVAAAFFLFFYSIISANTESRINQSAFVNEFFQQEFQDIQNKILNSKSLQKSAIGGHGGAILDTQALIFATDRDPLDVVLRRTGALLADLKKSGAGNLDRFEECLNEIMRSGTINGLAKTANATAVRQDLYKQAMALQRTIALANPLMDFDSLLFVVTRIPNGVGHIVCNYQGYIYNSSAIGKDQMSLYMITGLKDSTPVLTNIVEKSTIQNGRLKGTSLMGGAFLSPDLSYDGKTIAFAWREPGNSGSGGYTGNPKDFSQQFCWHIFKVNVDGSNCVQLTDGDYNDFDPCWLPNGRIAFVTERRLGFGRCHGWYGKTSTIFSMKDDGSDLYCIDYHETNEWHPSVDNNGRIIYSRWDYVDRDAIIAHNMWIMYPDGRDSRSWHANYPLPWSTIPGSPLNFGTPDGRLNRPMSELNIRAIPGSERYISTVAGHHSCPYGDLILIDLSVPDDNKNSQITGITTDNTRWYDGAPGTYASAWPLSEKYYICNYLSDLILLDKAGNKQVIFPLKNIPGVGKDCRCLDPIPVRARKKPPVIPTQTFQGERANLPDHNRAVISVVNVYNSDIPLPPGVKIKDFRIVQLLPKATPNVDGPKTNYASQALCRMSLGTAPVESDGSVYCEAPTGKALYFQILDENGCAVQSMRSASWVHDGEHLTCAGCHNDKWKSTPTGQPIAMKRSPSKLKPEYGSSVEPLTFYRTVKPVLDSQCAPCHKQGKGPDLNYGNLQKYAFCYDGPQDQIANAPGNGIYHGSRTTPGKHGALQSGLISHLSSSHHDVKLTTEQKRRITYWLDCGSMELGAYTKVDSQRAGKLVWPELDCDSANPQGIEIAFPSPDASKISGEGVHLTCNQPLEMRINGTIISLANPRRSNVRISLFDLGGRCVYTKEFRQHDARLSVDARNWPRARGMYLIKAGAEKSSASLMSPIIY